MAFGWSTKEMKLNINSRIGKDKHSVCYDIIKHRIVHNGKEFYSRQHFRCDQGDVIGCLIDVENQKFEFYYKGQIMHFYALNLEDENIEDDKSASSNEDDSDEEMVENNLIDGINFSTLPYHATASLSPRQQCHFNFGQSPFKFAPKNIQFRHFHEASGGDERRYRLAEIDDAYGNYWFKHTPLYNQVELYYPDNRQNQFNELVKKLQKNIQSDREMEKWKLKNMFYNRTVARQHECPRYIQSIIEEMGKEIDDDKVDVMAMWIGRGIGEFIYKANIVKLVELLYPYLQLRINSSQDSTKHRYICIVLSHLIMHSKSFYSTIVIRSEIFTYLTRTLNDTNDEWTTLFAFSALENLDLNVEEKKLMIETPEIVKLLEKSNNNETRNIIWQYFPSGSASYQLHLAREHFLTNVLNVCSVPLSRPATLNINDRTEHLKISHDLLSARSDWKWQSVRSVCHVNKGICYYEAVLQTNGPMRIGWSTKRNVGRTEVGGDMFSIAFDGFNRCVWHDDKMLKLKISLTRWKARDVIGCLIRVTKNKENNEKVKIFSFYFNGQLIPYQVTGKKYSYIFELKPIPKVSIQTEKNRSIYSSPHPYHASISLSSHQQVCLNFGQSPFKYPPKDYLSFYDYPQAFHYKSSINMSNNNITNSLISIQSTSKFKNLSLSCQNLKIDNILKKGLTVECITCPRCNKEIVLKRFEFDCCACLKPSAKTSSGNQVLAISANSVDQFVNKRKLVEEDPTSPTKLIKPDSLNNNETTNSIISTDSTITSGDDTFKLLTSSPIASNCLGISNQAFVAPSETLESHKVLIHPSADSIISVSAIQHLNSECKFCAVLTELKLIRFVCCNTITVCLNCLPQLRACPKCSRGQTANESTNSDNQNLECGLCCAEITARLLQFVCCHSMVICLDCLAQFFACPKCKARYKK